jgi:hypothetical protein
MQTKTLEMLLGHETGRSSEMVTRFQLLRDSNLLPRSRGCNAEFLSPDEIVSGILSTVASQPGFAAVTAIGLRKLTPVGAVAEAFAGAPTLAAALVAAITEKTLCESVTEVRLGDSTPDGQMATAAVIEFVAGGEKRITQYVPARALSLLRRGRDKDFHLRSFRPSIGQETFITARLLNRIVKDMKMAERFKPQEAEPGGERLGKPPTRVFPENFDILHQSEEYLRRESLEAIQASDALLHHFDMVGDSLDLIQYFVEQVHDRSESQSIVELLGVRLFNGLASTAHAMLVGYYQNSMMQQRDLLEVSFLLEYFRYNKALVVEWKSCTESERIRKFGAFQVRKFLDDRDSFTERKRETHYKHLCCLGANASYQGLQMLQPIAEADARCGLYFTETALTTAAGELAKISVEAANNVTAHHSSESLADGEIKLRFLKQQSLWFERFVGPAFDRGLLDRMHPIPSGVRAA